MKVTPDYIDAFDPQKSIPVGWIVDPSKTDRLLPPWPPCTNRRVSYNPVTMVVTPFCSLQWQQTTVEVCLACDRQNEKQVISVGPEMARFENVPPENFALAADDDDDEFEEISFDELPKEVQDDLETLRRSLLRSDANRGKKISIEVDGAVVYEKGPDDWEPPRDIVGYQRDPNNPWRFVPLWLPCKHQKMKILHGGGCGCIRIRMKCLNSSVKVKGKHLTHEQCQQCPAREEENP